MEPLPHVNRRVVPGTDRTVSELGIALDPDPAAAPATSRQQVGALRRARTSGVTLFDLAGARSPARAAWLLRTAFPDPDPELVVVVGLSRDEPAAPSAPATPRPRSGPPSPVSEADAETWLEELRPRLPPGTAILPEMRLEPREGGGRSSLTAVLASLAARRRILTFSTRVEREGVPRSGFGDLPSPVVSTELSLLDAPLLAPLAASATSRPVGVIVRDPFAGGRLDGTLAGDAMGERRPGRPPRDVRELREEFAPVLRLGFLTQARTRTLAQAALRYLLQPPGTLTVLLPPPAPERWEEILGAPGTAPLDEEELARLEGRTRVPEAAPRASDRK